MHRFDCMASRRDASAILERAGFSQRFIGTVLVDCLQATRRHANADKLFELRYPDALASQVWRENARHIFRDVPAHATLLFG